MILVFVFLQFFLLKIEGLNSEKLEIFQLTKPSKNLLKFTFEFTQSTENFFHNKFPIIMENLSIPRSVIDEIFLFNITNFHIEMASSVIHPLLNPLNFPFNLPEKGTKILLNPEVNFKNSLYFLHEIFGFTKSNFQKKDLIFLMKNNKEKQVLYGNDPTDFICTENIETIKNFLFCGGNKGLANLIEAQKVFYSEYVAIIGDIERSLKEIILRFEILFVVENNKLSKYLNRELTIKYCPIYNLSSIFFEKKEENKKMLLNEEKEINFGDIYFPKKIINRKEQIFKHRKISSGEWFNFKAKLIHEFAVKNQSVFCEIVEFFPINIRPILHKITYLIIGPHKQLIQGNFSMKLEKIEGKHLIIVFTVSIPKDYEAKLIIPVGKLLKTFEEYPHDPGRGHYFISTPLYCGLEKKSDYFNKTYYSGNILFKNPEPDFSMPFNILTYTMIVFGYFFVQVFIICFENGNDDDHWVNENKKLSIIHKIINFFKNFFRKKDNLKKKNE